MQDFTTFLWFSSHSCGKYLPFFLINVCFIKIRTKHSGNSLLSLVRFFMKQTLFYSFLLSIYSKYILLFQTLFQGQVMNVVKIYKDIFKRVVLFSLRPLEKVWEIQEIKIFQLFLQISKSQYSNLNYHCSSF